MDGRTVGEPALPLMQSRLVVYWASVLELPAAICSNTVVGTLDETVATDAVKGPLAVPLDVLCANMTPVDVVFAP